MNIRVLFLSLILFGNISAYTGLSPRPAKISMRTSVIIPCVARHFFWLSGILEGYQNGTVVPDEVVISLSEIEKLEPRYINQLRQGGYTFDLILIENKGLVIDGDNRTIAMDNSTGDILIFSDADDLPHPQRVEIVKNIFENYDVDHIIHGFTNDRKNVKFIDINNISTLKFNSFGEVMHFGFNQFPITTGSPCFLRKIGNVIKWQAIKDIEYNQQVYQLFKNNIVIPENLIIYRIHLSSHK